MMRKWTISFETYSIAMIIYAFLAIAQKKKTPGFHNSFNLIQLEYMGIWTISFETYDIAMIIHAF